MYENEKKAPIGTISSAIPKFEGDPNLSCSNIAFAHLNDANLSKTTLTNADFRGVNLDGADLSGALVDVDRLEKTAKSLKGATMPDGSIHP